jgi:adenylate cyclase, class 2
MQAAEIELKFPVTDPEALQSRLPHLGFQLATPRTYENNTLYDTPTRDLRARREVLRIRQYGGLCTVTHKRQPDRQDPVDVTRYKIRIETETIVAEGSALEAIFHQLVKLWRIW